MSKTQIINEYLRNYIAVNIINEIEKKKFGDGRGYVRMKKIACNIHLVTLQLLGESIEEDEIPLYITEYANEYIAVGINIGEASGEIAAQSLLQPVTQATLKSQHRAGSKDTGGGAQLLQLNKLSVTNHVFKIHIKLDENELVPKFTRKELSEKYEEVLLGDVLASTYGTSQYTPIVVDDYYSQDLNFVYINHRDIWKDDVVHRFRIDPAKLWDAGLTQMDIYKLLLEQTNLTIILHPMSKFIFDIYPLDGQRNTLFNKQIKLLLAKSLKGLKGLQMISDRTLKVDDVAPFINYDDKTNKTTVYINTNVEINFPIKELKKRIKGKLISDSYNLSYDEERAVSLIYDGKITVDKTPYTYFIFIGDLSIDDILNDIDIPINMDYFISNDAHEMIKFVGITGARIAHEYAYSESLNSSGTPLLYQNITCICRRIFSIKLMPITPSGYMNGSGITPLEKLGFQNYRAVLENEIVKGTRATTSNLPGAIMVGRKPKMGTGAIKTELIEEQRMKVIDLYSEARQAQKYYNKYKGISFPPFGTVKTLTVLNNHGIILPSKAKGI